MVCATYKNWLHGLAKLSGMVFLYSNNSTMMKDLAGNPKEPLMGKMIPLASEQINGVPVLTLIHFYSLTHNSCLTHVNHPHQNTHLNLQQVTPFWSKATRCTSWAYNHMTGGINKSNGVKGFHDDWVVSCFENKITHECSGAFHLQSGKKCGKTLPNKARYKQPVNSFLTWRCLVIEIIHSYLDQAEEKKKGHA